MRPLAALVRLSAATCVWALVMGGCGSNRAVPAKVILPDLSRVAQSVRDQIASQYSASMQAIENPAASDADRAAAYAEIGVLLMAADYRGAAEMCFINAQALA